MIQPNHLPPVDIDLSTYISDGEDHAPADKKKLSDTHCLTFLTRVFNNNGSAMEFWGRRVRFTALCPGYSMYRGHPHTYPDFEQERRVWGHPCGKPFPSMGVFAIHVRAVIEEYLRRCRCWLCDAPDTESDPSYVKGPFDLAKMRREGISLEEVRRKDKRLRRVGSTEIIPKRAGRAWSINRTLSVAADRPIHFLLTSEQRTWKQKADLTVLITPTKVKASQQSGADVIGLMRVNEALQQMYLPSLMRKGSTVLSLESLDIHVEFKIILPFDRKSVRA